MSDMVSSLPVKLLVQERWDDINRPAFGWSLTKFATNKSYMNKCIANTVLNKETNYIWIIYHQQILKTVNLLQLRTYIFWFSWLQEKTGGKTRFTLDFISYYGKCFLFFLLQRSIFRGGLSYISARYREQCRDCRSRIALTYILQIAVYSATRTNNNILYRLY